MSTDARNAPYRHHMILMPDICNEAPDVEEMTIVVAELGLPDDDECVGFDPYDTARLYKK